LYSITKEYKKSEQLYIEAIKIGKKLLEINQSVYAIDLGTTYLNFAILSLYKNSKTDIVTSYAVKALELFMPFIELLSVQQYVKTATKILSKSDYNLEQIFQKPLVATQIGKTNSLITEIQGYE
jgi:hypothetical protein